MVAARKRSSSVTPPRAPRSLRVAVAFAAKLSSCCSSAHQASGDSGAALTASTRRARRVRRPEGLPPCGLA